MKPSQLWRFHSSSEKYSCSNPLINVCLADVSMETVFTAPQCAKNGSKVIGVPGERKWHRYDGQRQRLTGVDLTCLIQHVCSLCPHSGPNPRPFSPVCLFKATRKGWIMNNTPPRLPPCVFQLHSNPKVSEQKQQHFHACERATWKPWQLLRGWCCVYPLLTPTPWLRPTSLRAEGCDWKIHPLTSTIICLPLHFSLPH